MKHEKETRRCPYFVSVRWKYQTRQGYDAQSQTYPSQFFDNYGGIHLGHWSVRDGVWSCTATEYRTTYTFSNDDNILAVHWEWFDGEDWLVWGDLKATKVE